MFGETRRCSSNSPNSASPLLDHAMIIACPQCATRYTVTPEAFEPDGRKVKCTSCSHTWHQSSVSEQEAELSSLLDDDDPPEIPLPQEGNDAENDVETETNRLLRASLDATERFRQSVTKRRGSYKEWGILVGGAVAIAIVVFGFREPIVRLLPSAAGLYAKVGLPVNLRGMDFADISYERQFENGVSVLAITGRIVNLTEREKLVPKVRFSLRDEDQQELYHWSMKIRHKPLAPNKSATFVARLASPPTNVRDVEIRFASSIETGMTY